MKREELDKIAEDLSYEEINYIMLKKGNDYLTLAREKVEQQCPSHEDVIAQLSEKQYVESLIEITPTLKAKFRTLTPASFDESLAFASSVADGRLSYERVLARRRLSYALIELNGRKACPRGIPNGSYHDYAMEVGHDQLMKDLKEYADENYKLLGSNGLADKLSETFGLWEEVISNRLNGIGDVGDILKN